ncbi:DNA methyltransferase [filamentous cyanobacterium CCT1]|nr:DNA methyltransferase [filamentous cyanobacterium CCT1]PSN77463.1 DNA methyltransferase [filamentous cyanobacterium CCP4]
MSRLLVTQYQTEIDNLMRYGGSRNEASIRRAFENLLNQYCKPRNFMLVSELDYKTKFNTTVRPDGTVKDAIRLEHGWWESKDQYDVLDEEIEKKFEKGYPDENILFEDSQTAVLIQHGREQARVSMRDADELDGLIATFIDYERPEVRDFRAAIKAFRDDIPYILEALRSIIAQQEDTNTAFRQRRDMFLELCRQSINPEIEVFDVHEMLIQHILTEDIFTNIFHESQFHRENNIAQGIAQIINTFFTGATRKNTLKSIEHYYVVIRRKSEDIANHHEKQKFLKAVYENFYKAYNPKAADRLGIVYTPNEIVRFMIESADYLTHKHFGKLLSDPGVEILDPCTGTGTYVTELIEYLPHDKLEHKYKHEIHCNEVAILPYYIANLNIEFTYQQKMGNYEEFKNICLVDTLDHCTFEGQQFDLFAMSVQNTTRISDQNSKNISVIIGNPPYNANQENENDNNRNRNYTEIDKQIKATYLRESKAQKTKLYDMYTRFFRWASSRLDRNGILAFITNSSFIDAKNFDGLRQVISREFSEIYVIDLGGNVRANSKLSGTTHNVFGIQTGVAISFMVKRERQGEDFAKIYYARRPEFETSENKLEFLSGNRLSEINFERVKPDKHSNWINLANNDFDKLLAIGSKASKSQRVAEAIFQDFSLGISTNRDEWVYDFSLEALKGKMSFFCKVYNSDLKRIEHKNIQDMDTLLSSKIKWSEQLKRYIEAGRKIKFLASDISQSLYRPYVKRLLYLSELVIDRPGLYKNFYPNSSENEKNYSIWLKIGAETPNFALAIDFIPNLLTQGGSHYFSIYRYDENGDRIDNITDWGLTQFQTHYSDPTITKLHIFHYTYAVLHHPAYRTKYELNLKREFPRLPYYPDFHQWATWGKTLMELHLTYETAEPFGLKRIDQSSPGAKDDAPLQASLIPNDAPAKPKKTPKPKLKADKTQGHIILDTDTTLTGVPAVAWDYKLGNRSALEWILDQYKEKKPKDPTIRELFNTYRFADYKEHVIDLLQRVCTVSVETMHIIHQMPDTVEHEGDL